MPSALSIRDLRKSYSNQFEALKGISLDVPQGEFLALLGPNGAGKSTTIGIISSLVRKTSGGVEIFGVDIDKDFSKAKKYLGVVPQEFNFNLFEKVEDILIQQAGYYGLPARVAREKVEYYLQRLELTDKRRTAARMLSGGMKRRLMIARALIHQPRLLILDEPTAGVDIELRRGMWDFLREINEAGTTIILTTHYLEEAENLCRQVAIIDRGEIIQNTSVKHLLQQLDKETFIFDLSNPITQIPDLGNFTCRLLDTHSIEVDLHKGQHLNDLFVLLNHRSLIVNSMRNKSNRLEELFVSLVQANKQGVNHAV
jgi:ABC-2 type transport system ATP-binding protein